MKRLWSLFRSPRKFFEQGGRDEMRAELERRLEPDIRRWMEERAAAWEAATNRPGAPRPAAAAERLADEIGAFIASSEAALPAPRGRMNCRPCWNGSKRCGWKKGILSRFKPIFARSSNRRPERAPVFPVCGNWKSNARETKHTPYSGTISED